MPLAAALLSAFLLLRPRATFVWTSPAVGSPAKRVSITIPSYLRLDSDTSVEPFEAKRTGAPAHTAYYEFVAERHKPALLRWLPPQEIEVQHIELLISYGGAAPAPNKNAAPVEKVGFEPYPLPHIVATKQVDSADKRVTAYVELQAADTSPNAIKACHAVIQSLHIR